MKQTQSMDRTKLQQAQKYLNQLFEGNQEDFFVEQDLLKYSKPKKFKFLKCLVTEKPISDRSHRNLFIKSLTQMKKQTTDLDQQDENQIITKLIGMKNEDFWIIFSKYDGSIKCMQFYIKEPLGITILPTVKFPILLKIMVHEIPLCSLQPFSWIDAPHLLDIRILRCQVTRVNGLDKAIFPNLLRIFLAQNHIIEQSKMSRIRFTKNHQSSDLRFVIRDKFFQYGVVASDLSFYNREQKFLSLEEFNDLNFVVKMEATNVVLNCMKIVGIYGDFLVQLYAFHTLERFGRSQDQVGMFWKKRPLVQVSIGNLSRSLSPEFYRNLKRFENGVAQQVFDKFGLKDERK